MKKYFTLLALVAFILTSCEGPVGPPGPPGPQGPPGSGDGLIGSVFEVQVDFDQSNEYSALVEIPSEIEVFDSDVVLTYVLTSVDAGTDIWEPLPQTLFFGDEILLYGYDYTFADVRLFMDGTVNFAGLDPVFTDGVVFRIAVIPADFAKQIDTGKLEDVLQALDMDEVEILR